MKRVSRIGIEGEQQQEPQQRRQQQPQTSTTELASSCPNLHVLVQHQHQHHNPEKYLAVTTCTNLHTKSPSSSSSSTYEHEHHTPVTNIVMQQATISLPSSPVVNNESSLPSTCSARITLHPISCKRCKSRHTRCDRVLPACSYCLKNNFECMYETPKKLRKNFNAEFVDLNEKTSSSMHASITHPQQPKSKYKVYKFKLNTKTKAEDEEPMEECEKYCVIDDKPMSARKLVEEHSHVMVMVMVMVIPIEKMLLLSLEMKSDSLQRTFLNHHWIIIRNIFHDLLALMYASQALILYFKEEWREAEEYYNKCIQILEDETESNRLLCLSTTFENRTMFFTSNRMDSQSLFLIGTRLILCQYKLSMGDLKEAVKFVRLADVMLDERFPVFKEQSFLPINANEIPQNLFDGISKEEILIIKKRIHCGMLLDELKFTLENLKEYIQPESMVSSPLFNNQSFILKESSTFQFSSFVNRFVFGNSIDIRGRCKYELLCLLQSPNVIFRNQTNVPFLIIGIAENNVKHLEEEALEQFGIGKVQAISLNESSSLDLNEFNQVVFVLQKIYLTSCSLLVLHEIIINSSQQFTQQCDSEIVEKCKIWRSAFADELSDYYALLPTETVNICLLVVAVFVVANIHADLIRRELLNKTPPPALLVRRMRNDFRLLSLLKRKFSNWFGSYHNKLCENIENLLNEIAILNKENL
ncbi:predicted protein [Naegleria gruberi]|uniref:Predicted protein n=1 Tax=Naegleria gruberi TaxID=5762 RepID=D2VY31_NAEGR|nr:uncharacterized protein NAEGRDRAFT_53162 [Naegleria gruberi]EFC38253.1 predicted protein [Naegleria gruberi]|eukprot:XP_002670997.1 predicted protein [Naegleria gruberi strain NEG-M]